MRGPAPVGRALSNRREEDGIDRRRRRFFQRRSRRRSDPDSSGLLFDFFSDLMSPQTAEKRLGADEEKNRGKKMSEGEPRSLFGSGPRKNREFGLPRAKRDDEADFDRGWGSGSQKRLGSRYCR